MINSLSSLNAVTPNQGRCQWVRCKATGESFPKSEATKTFGAPYLMPGILIFVHGVNSDGEWYEDAAKHFANGLNTRLGRKDIAWLGKAGIGKRFKLVDDKEKIRANSPVIPFYWGYSANKQACLKDCTKNVEGTTDIWTDVYGNPLRPDRSWGGGPFANGTTTVQEFWGEGFKAKRLNGLINLNDVNPLLGRDLMDCPERLYYVHAARRLANLVKTIRNDFPDEPINIIAHSQGTMIALCSLFFLDDVRGPDTILLNSSPFRLDTKVIDPSGIAAGLRVEGEQSRKMVLANAAETMAKSLRSYKPDPHPPADFDNTHVPRHINDDAVYVRHEPVSKGWEPLIGGASKNSMDWWKYPLHTRNNRGNIFVNFNPGDRVIGTRVVMGIGWRGIGLDYLNHDRSIGGENIYQRMFSRSTGEDNPAPGSRTNYTIHYYISQLERLPDRYGELSRDTDLRGSASQWKYFNSGTAKAEYRLPSEKILHALPILGTMQPQSNRPLSDGVYINAPLVPRPPELPEDFDGDLIRFDGEEDANLNTVADEDAIEDFKDVVIFTKHKRVPDAEPGQVARKDNRGNTIMRNETHKEVEIRLRETIGSRLVSPSNHAAILRFKSKKNACPVEHVLSYDLTVGPGYAWGDLDYWKYLLDLADWKISDPYFKTGLLEEDEKSFPAGITTELTIASGELYSDYPEIPLPGYVR